MCGDGSLRRFWGVRSRSSVVIIVGSVLGMSSVDGANDRRSSHISSSTHFIFPGDSNVVFLKHGTCRKLFRAGGRAEQGIKSAT